MSTYTPNVPVSGQSLGNSRPLVNANFTLIQSVFDENHVDFNDANAGFHTFVDLLSQGTTSANPPTGAVAHYSNAVAGNTEWFFQRENSGAAIQMSTVNGTPLASNNGQTFLPGGLVMKFGQQSFSGPGGVFVVFTTPFTNNLFSLQVTMAVPNVTIYNIPTGPITNEGFTVVNGSESPGIVYWMAIGN